MNLSDELVRWYQNNKRNLPWRDTNDAYVIWLSEIILQQTRVEQGLPYFYRFLDKYPDVKSFANADEGEILNLWQGLGYYSRGRNMLKTAQMVQQLYDGQFPTGYEQLLGLKGIGEYTAAAISSFSANEARAVVDGNVLRVIARYFGIEEPINSSKGKKIFQQIANELLNHEIPALHNQAMMEFGAMMCKPQKPACEVCPVSADCFAFLNNAIRQLPVKLNTVKIRERFFYYFLVTDGETILMNKRDESDIWANMHDLPLVETANPMPVDEVIILPQVKAAFGDEIKVTEILPLKKHVLTHQHLYVHIIQISNKPVKLEQKWFFTEVKNLKNLALPKIIFIFINKFFK